MTRCKLVCPGLVIPGTMSVTSSELYFDCDEEDPEFQQQDLKVSSKQTASQMRAKGGGQWGSGPKKDGEGVDELIRPVDLLRGSGGQRLASPAPPTTSHAFTLMD